MLAVVESVKTAVDLGMEFRQLGGTDLLMLFEEAKRFPDYLASRRVTLGVDFLGDECFQFRRERDVHGVPLWPRACCHKHFTENNEYYQCLPSDIVPYFLPLAQDVLGFALRK